MEPCTATPLPLLVTIQGRAYAWTPEDGLDPAATETVERWIWRSAHRMRFAAAMAGLSLDDLAQEGRLGALQAAKTWRPGKGANFMSWASWTVRARLQTACGRLSHHGLRDDGTKAEAIQARPRLQGWDSSGLDTWPGDAPDPHQVAARVERRGLLREAVDVLSDLEREVLERRFGLQGDTQTLAVIAADHGVTGEHIRQIQRKAMNRLRAVLAQKGVHA